MLHVLKGISSCIQKFVINMTFKHSNREIYRSYDNCTGHGKVRKIDKYLNGISNKFAHLNLDWTDGCSMVLIFITDIEYKYQINPLAFYEM